MAPPRKHETDVILDAARALVLDGGPRAASVAAIAKASGAPAGTLYHRFGNRDGILTAAWLRALERFQARAMAASTNTGADTPTETAVAMAVAGIGFAREPPGRRPAVADDPAGRPARRRARRAFQETLAAMNAPLIATGSARLARQLFGSSDRAVRRRRRASGCRPALCRGSAPRPRRVRCRPGWKPMSRRRRGRCYRALANARRDSTCTGSSEGRTVLRAAARSAAVTSAASMERRIAVSAASRSSATQSAAL